MVSWITGITISNRDNDIRCEYLYHKKTKKFAGTINLYKNDHIHTILLSGEPKHETPETAIASMEEMVTKIKEKIQQKIKKQEGDK